MGDAPTQADVRTDLSDTDTVRLWDYRPLLAAYSQLQGLRQYYQFSDVDIDRYQIGGQEHPLFLSARELSSNSLPQQNWLNRHLVFTHGFGAVASTLPPSEGAREVERRDRAHQDHRGRQRARQGERKAGRVHGP